MKQPSRIFAVAALVLIAASAMGGCAPPQEEAMEDEAEAMESQASEDDGESDSAQGVPEL